MKRTLLINQQAAVESGLDVDFTDLIIFDYIKDFANSSKIMRVQIGERQYFWLSHTKIMEDLPLLGIKTKMGIMKRLERLINAGLLLKAPESQQAQKSLYCFGPLYDVMISAENLFTPQNENFEGSKQNFRRPQNENFEDNYNRDNLFTNTPSDDGVITRAKKSEEKQCLFSSLEIAKDVKAGLTGEWYELFQKYTDEGIDIMAYFDAVYNWSDMKSVKRTRRGWIATIHEWIKRDRESGRLKMMAGAKTASERAFEEAAAEYLKEGGFYK